MSHADSVAAANLTTRAPQPLEGLVKPGRADPWLLEEQRVREEAAAAAASRPGSGESERRSPPASRQRVGSPAAANPARQGAVAGLESRTLTPTRPESRGKAITTPPLAPGQVGPWAGQLQGRSRPTSALSKAGSDMVASVPSPTASRRIVGGFLRPQSAGGSSVSSAEVIGSVSRPGSGRAARQYAIATLRHVTDARKEAERAEAAARARELDRNGFPLQVRPLSAERNRAPQLQRQQVLVGAADRPGSPTLHVATYPSPERVDGLASGSSFDVGDEGSCSGWEAGLGALQMASVVGDRGSATFASAGHSLRAVADGPTLSTELASLEMEIAAELAAHRHAAAEQAAGPRGGSEGSPRNALSEPQWSPLAAADAVGSGLADARSRAREERAARVRQHYDVLTSRPQPPKRAPVKPGRAGAAAGPAPARAASPAAAAMANAAMGLAAKAFNSGKLDALRRKSDSRTAAAAVAAARWKATVKLGWTTNRERWNTKGKRS